LPKQDETAVTFDRLIVFGQFDSVRGDLKSKSKNGIVKLHTSCAGMNPQTLKQNNVELAFVPVGNTETPAHTGGPATHAEQHRPTAQRLLAGGTVVRGA
jgi:hypothetical protein